MGKLTKAELEDVRNALLSAANTLLSAGLSREDKAYIALLGNFARQAYKAADGNRARAIRMASRLGIGEKEFLHTLDLLGLQLSD